MAVKTRAHRREARTGVLFFSLAISGACAHTPPPMHPSGPEGSFYVIQAGDTLASLARERRVPLEDLAEINGLPENGPLTAGQVIFVLTPDPLAPAPAVVRQAEETAAASLREAAAPTEKPGIPETSNDPGKDKEGLRWPLPEGRISSAFGRRWGRKHEGIDLAAPVGTPVLAAKGGRVLYAGNSLQGYGNMVVLQHADDLLTAYAHNSVLLVRVGDRVRAGQTIARVGQSGKATGPHLHFEVRQGQIPVNPLRFLQMAR
jgi:murein DD-endopeptidase MepM/ murein hydrolase activator NlpD